MTSHESFSVSPCVSPLLSKGPMGLRGYPGMMGPKGEAVSTPFLYFCLIFLSSPSFSSGKSLLSFLDEHQGGTARPAPTIQTSSITSNGDIWK